LRDMHPLPNAPPFPRDELWRKFEFLRQSLAAVAKSQARFVATLLSYLAILWGLELTKLKGVKLTILGVDVDSDVLWKLSPAVLTVLVLALIGSMNIMGPIWKRLRNCCTELQIDIFWTDVDPNKNLIDYFNHVKLWPEGPVQPVDNPPPAANKYRISVFSYQAVIALATVTTALADDPRAAWPYRVYVFGCTAIQFLFSFRTYYRAVCRFFGVRKEQTET
jgi:hypothetical protein